MTFTTEKEKRQSNRFMLARIEPGRDITNDMISRGGGVYDITLPAMALSRVVRHGVTELTETSNDPPTANDTYNFNTTTNLLKIKTAASPSSSNTIIVFHYLFFTGEKFRYAPADPEASSGIIREWTPAIQKYPAVSNTMRNIAAGIVSISNTSFTLVGAANTFINWLSIKDSFFNKRFDVWTCINDISNIKKTYTGKIRTINVKSDGSVALSIYDNFSKLQQTALMGDSVDKAYFNRSTNSWPNMKPDEDGTPCRFAFGRMPHITESGGQAFLPTTNWERRNIVNMQKCVCLDYVTGANAIASDNRLWGAVRLDGDGYADATLGTVVRWVDHVIAIGTEFRYLYLSGNNLRIGQTVRFLYGVTFHYSRVVANEDFTYSGNTYNISLEFTAAIPVGAWTNIAAGPDVQVALVKSDGVYMPLHFSQDYNLLFQTLPSGNKIYQIQLNFNFETNSSGSTGAQYYASGVLNPDNDNIHACFNPDNNTTHANAIKKIVAVAGMSTDSSSYTAADSALDANVRFMIPEAEENEYKNYRNYVERILQSTLGYVRINSDIDVEYHLLGAPSSTNEITASEYDSISYDINYADIATEVRVENPSITDPPDLDKSTSPAQTAVSNIAKHLHETENVYELKHVLERYDNRITALLQLRRERRIKYSFQTSTKNIDSLLGDDVKIVADTIPGGSGSAEIKINHINISPSKTKIEGDDLEGLP